MEYTILTTDEALTELEPILIKNKLALFAGSGISVPHPSNLPLWSGLIMDFIDFCEHQSSNHPNIFSRKLLIYGARQEWH